MVNYQHQGECVSLPKGDKEESNGYVQKIAAFCCFQLRGILRFLWGKLSVPIASHSCVFLGFSETSLKFKNMHENQIN